MSNVREIRSKTDEYENIPHMLRELADRIEKGDEKYITVWCVCLADLDEVPGLYMYGRMVPRLIEVGALTAIAQSLTAVDCIE